MSYLPLPGLAPGLSGPGSPAGAAPPGLPAEAAIRALLSDLAGRKEFCASAEAGPPGGPAPKPKSSGWGGFGAGPYELVLRGLRLSGAQVFVRNFENPDTEYRRLLIEWQTGTGKSIAAISIGNEFVRQYRARASLGEDAPAVFIISFTARETIQEDMLAYPEFGFVSAAEVEELRRLRGAAAAAGPASVEARQLSGFVGVLRRRITDRSRGGYYQFYGYKEFANRLFAVTRQGLARGFDIQALYSRSVAGASGEAGSFGARLAEAVRRGDVVVNEELLHSLRGGLIIADEIHNVYNILEENNYGIAIQYVLDALGADAPRAVYMSATPMTGSAAEVVDLLNLLVPRSALPGGVPLRRADFFVRGGLQARAEPGERAAPGERAEPGEPPSSPAPAAGDLDDEEEGPALVVSQLREGALERIARLAAGRVSFLLDADVGSYPRRLFVGDEVPGVPYLRLTLCPMSPFHARTLAREQAERGKPESAGLAASAYTLYDMAFPNPDFAPDAAETNPDSAWSPDASYGLYRSGETPARLTQAPEEWRAAAGVVVERGAEAGVSAGTAVISGAFLGPGRLGLYSSKLARIVEATLAALRAGPGKIMIYHHRVRMSGVLLVQEALRMNGLADETSAPTDATLCGVCGVARAGHAGAGVGAGAGGGAGASGPGHEYTPARFVVAHSDIDRSLMLRSLARYNAAANRDGYQFRVVVGSKVIREGLNFRAVRHQLNASLPTDYPTFIQVFGRVARKFSHSELPEDQRDVSIRIFVSARADGRPSPELQRYADKGREYLVIQEVERALRTYAVDGFANWGRIRAALGWQGEARERRATLDALVYEPAVGPADVAAELRVSTFEAYGHGEREAAALAAICRVLFRARPVWTYGDLWAAVRAGAVRGTGLDPARFDEGNFALALEGLGRPAGAPPTAVVRAGRYYVLARIGPGGSPVLDIESYLRDFPPRARESGASEGAPVPSRVAIRLADYLREARSGQSFAVRLREFEEAYLRPGAPSTPELSLVELGAEFHYALLRRLVTAAPGERVTSDDERVCSVYRRFRIAVTAADAAAVPRVFRGARAVDPEALVGYVTPDAVALFERPPSRAAAEALPDDAGSARQPRGPGESGASRDSEGWYSASLADFGIGRRHRENDIVVGFVAPAGAARAMEVRPGAPGFAARGAPEGFAATGAEVRFKIRPPIQKLKASEAGRKGDVRTLARGAVCETRPREELEEYLRALRVVVARTGAEPQATRGGCPACLASRVGGSAVALQARLDYAARFDRAARKRFPSANEMCDALRLHLLALEEHARAPVAGMADGLRWVYLFSDRAPTVSALMGDK